MAVSPLVGSFVAADYAVFALMLLVSAVIGVYYATVGRGQSSSKEFLMGGRRMTAIPVALSLTASFMSAITVLATPAEVYQYGASFGLFSLSYVLVVVFCSEIFLPVFYRLDITSTYEYLEMRFNKATRLLGTVMFIVQTILYTGIVIYAPALALNQVTGMDLWGAVISTGVVCTFYCTLGGLKAVVWTDVFQVGIMVAGFLSVIIRAVVLQGGVANILQHAEHGGRLNFWECVDFLHCLKFIFCWNSVSPALSLSFFPCLSLSSPRSLYINLIGLWVIMLCSVSAGLCLYSVYKNCDPWTAGMVSAPDQLMPYMVMDTLRDYPGLPGLFVAAAYSGTLSTVSSSINALAAVTIEDLIKPHIRMSETHLSWTSKGLSFLYGAVCIGMAGIASLMGGLLQAAITIFGIIGGPLLGLFSLGILCPYANATGGLTGLLFGLAMSLWVGIGAQFYPPLPEQSRPLGLTTHGCNFTTTANLFNWTATSTQASLYTTLVQPFLADNWYSMSYLYFSPIGTLTALIVGLVVSLLSGGMKLKLEPRLTLMKSDTTFYCFYKLFEERVSNECLYVNKLHSICFSLTIKGNRF
uniref:Solute carrier family 5 member 8 n=1 Tax=Esox lucius TaxID=8010 RepID=A0A6Q2Y2N6_ESOLU